MENTVVFQDAKAQLKTLTWKILVYHCSKSQVRNHIEQHGNRAIQTVRRKGPNDTFDPKNKKHTYVCKFHFKAEDIQVSFGIGQKRPIDKRPPTLFKCVEEELKPKRRSPKKRLPPIIESSESEVLSDSESDEYADDVVDNEDFETIEMTELELLRKENEELKNKCHLFKVQTPIFIKI